MRENIQKIKEYIHCLAANCIQHRMFLSIICCVLLVLFLFFSIISIGVYKKQWSGSFTQKIIKIIPYPAVVMKGKNISQDYFLKYLNAQKHYYQTQKKINLNELEKTKELKELKEKTLNTLIKESFIRYTLAKHKVLITQQDVDQEFVNSSAGKTKDQIESRIQDLYGWTSEEFKQELIKPYLEKQKLQKIIVFNKEINKDQIKKAESILEELKQGADFIKLANKYSEDPGNYQNQGGDLGWVVKGQMVPEFEQAAFSLKSGQVSEIITTQFGFHIIKSEESQPNKIHARHILIKPYDFNQWLDKEIKNAKAWKMNLDLL